VSAITLKNIPDELIAGLKVRAAAAHRSLNGEILYRLQRSLESGGAVEESVLREQAAIQADAWAKVSGRWSSDLSPAEEIESLYAARTAERNVDLHWE
jgi:plasmid stability protein